MPQGGGFFENIGTDLLANNAQKRQSQRQDRDSQAAVLEKQLEGIAENRAKVQQEISMLPADSPDRVEKSKDLEMLQDQLGKATAAYRGLYANDTATLLDRMKGWVGKHMGVQSQQQPTGGSPVTPDMMTAAAPRAKVVAPEPNKFFSDFQGEIQARIAAGQSPEQAKADALKAMQIKGGLLPKAEDKPSATKPLEAKYHPSTGGLNSILDPNKGASYTSSNIAEAPPEVQRMWTDLTKQSETEMKRKDEAEAKKNQEADDRESRRLSAALDRQQKGFQLALDRGDYRDAKKTVLAADNDYQGALDRVATMDQNIEAAKKGDQQAMLSLVANHIGMTLGAQKGARITQAVWNEAVASTPLLQKLGAKWSDEGYLSGVTLAPEQMKQMVNLAHEKVDILKQHKERVAEEYADVLSQNEPSKKTPSALKDKAKPSKDIKSMSTDELLKELAGGKK